MMFRIVLSARSRPSCFDGSHSQPTNPATALGVTSVSRSGPGSSGNVLVELPAVVVARVFTEPTAAAAVVALDPLGRVVVQREPGTLLELAAANVGLARRLRASRLLERAAGLPPLFAVDAVAEHVPAAALVDARGSWS